MPATSFLGRSAWRLETPLLRATVLQGGGHLTEFVLKGQNEINPLWIQARPTIDSDAYSPATHGAVFGTRPESRLLSGLAGHNLCFPFWGNPSEAEFAAGMTFHGETNIRQWRLIDESANSLTLEVVLPESAIRIRRHLRAKGYALHVESIASNLTTWDRPVGWCEHVTLGPPFLDATCTQFDASAGTGIVTGEPEGVRFDWPQGVAAPANSCDSRQSFNLGSFTSSQHSPLVNSFLVNRSSAWGHFTAYNAKYALLCGYCFPVADFPWLNVWQNNDDEVKTRGMEFSNTPHHGTMRTLISRPEMWGVPTYDWLNAKASLTKRFIAFSFPVPFPFDGTDSIKVYEDALEVHEKGTTRVLRIPI